MYLAKEPAGTYLLKPKYGKKKGCNQAVKLTIIPDRNTNPNFLDFIVFYEDGSSFIIRSNTKFGNTYFRYNDAIRVLYHIPQNLQYQLNLDTGNFQALTECIINGKHVLSLMEYEIVQKIGTLATHANF